MGEKARLLHVPGSFRKFQQGLISWTVDALRIGEVLVDDPFKRFQQLLFRTHSALPGGAWSPSPIAVAPSGESHDSRLLSMKIFVCIHGALLLAVLT